jgi:hypothetical protein
MLYNQWGGPFRGYPIVIFVHVVMRLQKSTNHIYIFVQRYYPTEELEFNQLPCFQLQQIILFKIFKV